MSHITECVLYLSYDDEDDPDGPGLVQQLTQPVPEHNDQSFRLLDVTAGGGAKPIFGAVLAAGFNYLNLGVLLAWLEGMPWSDDSEIGAKGVLVYRQEHAAWGEDGPVGVMNGVVRFGAFQDVTRPVPPRRGRAWCWRQFIPRGVREDVAEPDLHRMALGSAMDALGRYGWLPVDESVLFEWQEAVGGSWLSVSVRVAPDPDWRTRRAGQVAPEVWDEIVDDLGDDTY